MSRHNLERLLFSGNQVTTTIEHAQCITESLCVLYADVIGIQGGLGCVLLLHWLQWSFIYYIRVYIFLEVKLAHSFKTCRLSAFLYLNRCFFVRLPVAHLQGNLFGFFLKVFFSMRETRVKGFGFFSLHNKFW